MLFRSVIGSKEREDYRIMLTMNNVNQDMLYKEELRTNAELINMIMSTMNAGIKVALNDDKHSIIYVNESLYTMLGYTKEEFYEVSGGCMSGLIYPDDLEKAWEDNRRHLVQGDEYRCEYRVIKKDGTLMWLQDTGKKFLDIDGVFKFNSVLTDITPLKDAMIALKYQAEFDFLTGLHNKQTFYKNTQIGRAHV